MKMKLMIKRFALLSPVLLLALTASTGAAEIKLPSLEGLPSVDRNVLDNGIKVLSIKDELPRTEIYCEIGYGKIHETPELAGLADILARNISISGTVKYPANELQEKIESVGGEISIRSEWENIIIVIKVLSKHTGLAFSVLGDILKEPVMEDSRLQYPKKLVYENFVREMDEPAAAGFVKLREIIFDGRNYGSVISENSINRISAGDLKRVWDKYACGSNINIAVSSSLTRDELARVYSEHLSGVKAGQKEMYTVDNKELLAEIPEKSKNIYLVPRELDQATIVMGTVAPDIKYEGNYALFMMNYILGGGSFNSRLMSDIRVKRGLAYSVFSLVRSRSKTGVFMSFVQTRNDEAANVLALMKENISGMYKEDVPVEELDWAKESVLNSYVFNFAKTSDILSNYLEIEFNELDRNYYTDYPAKIKKVTPDDIKRESVLLFKQGVVVVVVGKKSLAESLKSSGNVVIIE